MSHPWRKIVEVTMECDLGDGVARHTTWAADRETAEWEWRRDYGVAAEFKGFTDISQLPPHRLAEIKR